MEWREWQVDLRDRNPILGGEPSWSCADISWSPDGKYIAGATDNGVVIRDAKDGKEIKTIQKEMNFNCVDRSPNGKYIATVNPDLAQVWEVSSGKHLFNLPEAKSGSEARWSPDGKYIAGISGKTAKVWSVSATRADRPFTLQGHAKDVECLAWSPDSSKLIREALTTPRRCGESKTASYFTLQLDERVLSASWSPDGHYIATGNGDSDTVKAKSAFVSVWQAHSGKRLAQLPSPYGSLAVAWNPVSRVLAAHLHETDSPSSQPGVSYSRSMAYPLQNHKKCRA